MLHVQHLVVHDVVDDVGGSAGVIEYATDEDHIVRRVVAPQDVPRSFRRPAESWPRQGAAKVLLIETVEGSIEIDEFSSRCGLSRSSPTRRPSSTRTLLDLRPKNERSIALVMRAVRLFTVQLC